MVEGPLESVYSLCSASVAAQTYNCKAQTQCMKVFHEVRRYCMTMSFSEVPLWSEENLSDSTTVQRIGKAFTKELRQSII